MINRFRKMRSGQVTLLALLLGILGLTIGLSVASRSLSDLKQASYVDFGTKALAAAEAGAEYGLYQVSLAPPTLNCGNPQDVVADNTLPGFKNNSALNIKSIFVEMCQDTSDYFSKEVASDEVLQVNLTDSINALNPYYVMWNDLSKGDLAKAMEVTVLYADYSIKRFAYNSGSQTLPPWNSDNFVDADNPTPGNSKCASGLDRVSGAFSATNGNGNFVLQIRAKPLGGASTVMICRQGVGIDSQQYVVTSTATTKNNVTKKIQVTKEINGTLPSVFDNVIFSGGNLIK